MLAWINQYQIQSTPNSIRTNLTTTLTTNNKLTLVHKQTKLINRWEYPILAQTEHIEIRQCQANHIVVETNLLVEKGQWLYQKIDQDKELVVDWGE